MGYYTTYNFSYQPADRKKRLDPNDVERIIEFFDSCDDMFDDCDEDYSWATRYSKWFDWETPLVKISKELPNVVFRIDGSGEDCDDIWGYYIWRGEIQRAVELVYYKFEDVKPLFNLPDEEPEPSIDVSTDELLF